MPGLNPAQEDIEQFVAITQASHEDAQHFLSSGTTLQGAIEDFFAAQTAGVEAPNHDLEDEEDESALDEAIMSHQDQDIPEKASQPQGAKAGGMTLGGQPVDTSLPAEWGKKERKSGRVGDWTAGQGGAKPGGIATLFNTGVAASNPPPPGGDEFDDQDSDEARRKRGEELYAGGERSGLAIQNPGEGAGNAAPGARGIMENILRQAAANGANPARGSATAPRSQGSFGGSGNTLGSDETPSSAISDPSAPPAPPAGRPSVRAAPSGLLSSLLGRAAGALGGQAPTGDEDDEPVARHLTFWRDGFSIEDGPLLRYDEPGNKELLETIQAGRAPPHLFGIRFNQAMQLEVAQRTTEEYRPPPKKPAKPFEGSGNRLGSPAPESAGSGNSTPSMPIGMRPQGILQGGTQATTAPNTTGGAHTKFEVDDSKPTTSVQVRLGDGTRMVARVNLTHTVGDLRNFVSDARPDARSFVLQTTFPSRELSDSSETVEAAKLQNAVVVQRYA